MKDSKVSWWWALLLIERLATMRARLDGAAAATGRIVRGTATATREARKAVATRWKFIVLCILRRKKRN